MATLIADTVKARASFPVAISTDVQVSDTDTRSVKKAFDDLDSKYCNINDYYDKDDTEKLVRKTIGTLVDDAGTAPTANQVNDSPVGTVISFMGNAAPAHYLVCDGSIYNIADYQELADFINTEFGSYNKFGGDGTTTFAVPNLQGEFLRGTGTNSHTDTVNGIKQGDGLTVGEHQDATVHVGFYNYSSGFQAGLSGANNAPITNQDTEVTRPAAKNFSASWSGAAAGNPNKGFTSRPTNTSVLFCIKYESTYYLNINQEIGFVSEYYDDYTKDEYVVGKWSDGRPVYQKMIAYKPGGTGEKTFNHGIPNVAMAWTQDAFFFDGGCSYSISAVFSSQSWNVGIYWISQTQVSTWVGGSRGSQASVGTWYIKINYTKTTDSANSFNPQMIIDHFTPVQYIGEYATDSEVNMIFGL